MVALLPENPNPSRTAQAARAIRAATNRVKKLQNRGLNPAGFFHEAAGGKTVSLHSYEGGEVHQQSKRTGVEQKWFSLTGRVVAMKVEADGDLHIALSDATGNKQGIVVVEIPLGLQWCDIRTTVFSWTPIRFPLQTRSTKRLKVINPPIIAVIGKAFWDIGHAPKDQSNRRKYMPRYSVWEIHPVMKLTVQ